MAGTRTLNAGGVTKVQDKAKAPAVAQVEEDEYIDEEVDYDSEYVDENQYEEEY